jgi:hypothetical protein
MHACIQPAPNGASTAKECFEDISGEAVLNGGTMVPLVMSTFGKLGPAAEVCLQNIASVACPTGVVDRGVWLRISRQYLSCALVRGRGIAFRH